jgi:CBS domain-containing protein
MRTKVVALPADATIENLRHVVLRKPNTRGKHLFPVVDDARRLSGVITRKRLRALTQSADPAVSLGDMVRHPVVAWPDEPLHAVVFRMAETGLTRMPVIESDSGKTGGSGVARRFPSRPHSQPHRGAASRARPAFALPRPQFASPSPLSGRVSGCRGTGATRDFRQERDQQH